jgi:hypothetical protein
MAGATLRSTTLMVVLSIGAWLTAGCASSPDVRVNRDPATDFARYRTFGFLSPLGTDREGYQTLVSQQLKAATQRELEARGLQLSATSPQLLVNFSARLNDKLRVSTVPAPTMGVGIGFGRGYYGYRSGVYGAWPLYADQTVTTPYTEGTLNIDLVDADRKQLVWEGVVSGSVTQKTLDDLAPAIEAAVAAAFEQYPVPKR